jgi:hypothetical protein
MPEAHRVTKARVLTFHVDDDELPELTKAVDAVADEYSMIEEFRGLLCLKREGIRNEMIVVTLWDGDGLEATNAQSETNRRRIAATTDLGVCTRRYEVLRQIRPENFQELLLAESMS